MIRLLKVNLQPVFISDDGDDVVEHVVAPITLTAAQWRSLDPAAFAEQGIEAVAAHVGLVAK